MVTENSKENLGLLTEKLNNGFFIDDRITVGRSTMIVLQKRETRTTISRAVADRDDMCEYSPVRV